MKYWLRWLGVLPCAIFARFLADFPLHWLLYSLLTDSELVTPYPESPERLLSPFVGAAAFVVAGSKVSPASRKRTALGLLAVWLTLLASAAVYFVSRHGADAMPLELSYRGFMFVVSPLMSIGGAILGVWIVSREKRYQAPEVRASNKLSTGGI